MSHLIEKLIARVWNGVISRRRRKNSGKQSGLNFGLVIRDGQVTKARFSVGHGKRAEHVAVLGKTGSGKSYFLRHLMSQDISAGHGFVAFDLHGDATPFLLQRLAEREQREHIDLSEKVIVIDPADAYSSIGLNVLETREGQSSFVQITEFTQILKVRWHLEHFGARTEELLRSALFVLCENQLTLLELSPLLTSAAFRATCLGQVSNPEVVSYFTSRYDQVSDAMQSVMRDAILNKVSAFTADPHFRHILGQKHSTISLEAALDSRCYVLVNLHKGKLGEEAATLGSLILSKLKNALFARRNRALFTLYCDEVQNLVAYDSGLDTLLSEARKFAVSVVTANQFLDQYPPAMRSAVLSVGTHVCFQLAGPDAEKMSPNLSGNKSLAELLKNLPHQELVAKSGSLPPAHVRVPNLNFDRVDYRDLLMRSRGKWARSRAEVEREIQNRLKSATETQQEVLDGWE